MTGALPGKDTPAAHTAPASTTSRRPEADEQNAPPARATDPADPAQPAPPPQTWNTISHSYWSENCRREGGVAGLGASRTRGRSTRVRRRGGCDQLTEGGQEPAGRNNSTSRPPGPGGTVSCYQFASSVLIFGVYSACLAAASSVR